jgi:hypothetical protein
MKKLPRQLKIGGRMVTVDRSKKLKGMNGEMDYTKNTIYICKTLPISWQESTLLHEAFHAMNVALPETLIESLAEQLYQVLKDNKLHFG